MMLVWVAVVGVLAGAPGVALAQSQYPFEWTPEWKAKLIQILRGNQPTQYSEAELANMLGCAAANTMAALPGGPRQFVEMLNRDPAGIQQIVLAASKGCARSFVESGTSTTTWNPIAEKMLAQGCRDQGFSGDSCACVLRVAKAHFAGPAEWKRFSSLEEESMSPSDRERSDELAKCLSDEPVEQEAALVNACSHSSPRPWCACLAAESKKQLGSPDFFGRSDEPRARGVIDKCVHLRGK